MVSSARSCADPTGGRHVELGMAIAWKIPILIIGERSNVFHVLPQVRVIDDTEDIAKHVDELARMT